MLLANRRPFRFECGRPLAAALMLSALTLTAMTSAAAANPRTYRPTDDALVLADIPASARNISKLARSQARDRIDVVLPLAQFYVKQARSSGDLRFLGYAEGILKPWIGGATPSVDALVLHATILQSRHDFVAALAVLDQALAIRNGDAQAWLTRATVLRVLGRYDESLASCQQLTAHADPAVATLCTQSLLGLTGHLEAAYNTLVALSSQDLPNAERAWRDSELGEMAVRLGRDDDAEHWFRNGLLFAPDDFYIRAAYADLLLKRQQPQQVLTLLKGGESLEPLLLRITIAQKMLGDAGLAANSERLATAFATEAQRGDGVHRREEARFLLDVKGDHAAALRAATANWRVQHEPDDVLVLVRAAQAADSLPAAAPALAFIREHRQADIRVTTLINKQS